MGSKVGYGRVSTSDQHSRGQLDQLIEAGVDKDMIFIDEGVSGVKASRPQLDLCLAQLRRGDTLIITRLDRLGRSVSNLVALVKDLGERGVDLIVLTQGIDTSTPGGKLVFHIMASLAEFEHDLIVARTNEGLAAARARGKMGGRKPSYSAHQARVARKLHAEGELTAEEIGVVLGVSRATVFRMIKNGDPMI
jgi:DNA invertase Pin-like site-specific DNA recombinase